MKINELRCLLISDRKKSNIILTAYFHRQGINNLKVLGCNKNSINQALSKSDINILLIDDAIPQALQFFAAQLTYQCSRDTLLVFFSEKRASKGLTHHASTLEYCILSYQDIDNDSPFFNTILSYSYLKFKFRQAKALLSISEQKIGYLVHFSQNAIAYITLAQEHIQANAAYLMLFSIKNIHELRKIPLKQLLVDNDTNGFEMFYHQHANNINQNNALVLKMKSLSGDEILLETRLMPVIYRRKRCNLLWLKVISEQIDYSMNDSSLLFNKGKNLQYKNKVLNSVIVRNKRKKQANQLLVKLLKNNKPKLKLNQLESINKKSDSLYIASLLLPKEIMCKVDQLLKSDAKSAAYLVWDRILLDHLCKYHVKNKNNGLEIEKISRYLIKINIQTLLNSQFRVWLANKLALFDHYLPMTNQLILAVSVKDAMRLMEASEKQLIWLKKIGFGFVVTHFVPSQKSLDVIEHFNPTYVWLSKSWLDVVVLNADTVKQFNQFNHLLQSLGKQTIVSMLEHPETMSAIKTNYCYRPKPLV